MQCPFECHDFTESIPNRTCVKLHSTISDLNVLLSILPCLKTKTTAWAMINQLLPTYETAEEKVLKNIFAFFPSINKRMFSNKTI